MQAQLGQAEEVLFEQQKEQGLWEGYTRNYTHVLAPSGGTSAGSWRRCVWKASKGKAVWEK